MKKRGRKTQTEIIVSVLLIIIVIAAVAIIGTFINNSIKQDIKKSELLSKTSDIYISKAEIIGGAEVEVTIARGSNTEPLKGIRLVLSNNAGQTQTYEDTTTTFTAFEEKKITVFLTISPPIMGIDLYPLFSLDGTNLQIGSKAGYTSAISEKTGNTIANGLVGYWKLDGDASDSSGMGNTGTLQGGVNCNVNGALGKACLFDGVDDWINMSNPSSLNKDFTQLTLAGWVKAESIATGAEPLLFGKGASLYGLTLYNNAGTHEIWSYINNSGNSVKMGYNSSLGSWHHIVGVFNGTTKLLYLDGVLISTASSSSSSTTTGQEFNIGRRFPYFFNGTLDEIRIYNRSLSSSEVSFLYNSVKNNIPACTGYTYSNWSVCDLSWKQTRTINSTVPEVCSGGVSPVLTQGCIGSNGLVGYWPFEGNANDASGNNNNGTLNGGMSCNAPGKTGLACLFDGVNDYVNISSSSSIFSLPANKSFALSAWFNSYGSSSYTNLRIIEFYSNRRPNVYVSNSSSPKLYFTVRNISNCGSVCDKSISGSTEKNSWIHFFAEYNENTQNISLYLNGNLERTLNIPEGTYNFNISSYSPIMIGSYYYPPTLSTFFNGTIDEVRIYNRSLNLSEIAMLYSLG